MKKSIITISIIFLVLNLFSYYKENLDFGKNMYEEGLYNEAINELNKVIEKAPTALEAEEALLLIAKSYKSLGELNQAEEILINFKEGYPKSNLYKEVIFSLAQIQFDLGKYQKSQLNFKLLIDNFPKTEFALDSVIPYLENFRATKKFSRLVENIQNLKQQYPELNKNPDLLYLQAIANFELGNETKAKGYSSRIELEFPLSAARWKILKFQAQRIAQQGNLNKAISILEEKFEQKIPRRFEIELKLFYSQLLMDKENYESAAKVLEILINKYSQSSIFDKLLYNYTYCLIELNEYQVILDFPKIYKKIMLDSSYKSSYKILMAKAFLGLSKIEKALNEISMLDSSQEKIKFEKLMLQAKIYEAQSFFSKSIKIYNNLLEKNTFSQKNQILLNLGDIYFYKLKNYHIAQRYYQQLLTVNNKIYDIAEFHNALCYANLGKFNQAYEAINKIDHQNIKDTKIRKKIISKKNYWFKYKINNYKSAFENLFILMNNKSYTTSEIVEILAYDLKNYEKAFEMIKENGTNYQKAQLALDLLEKSKYENDKTSNKKYLSQVDNFIENMRNSNNQEKFDELFLRKKVIMAEAINSSLNEKLEGFVNSYPDNKSTNYYLLILADNTSNIDKKVEFYNQITKTNKIPQTEFMRMKLFLAEYYYEKENFEIAYKNYKSCESLLNLGKPHELFHYIQVLAKVNFKQIAIERLSFLVRNNKKFKKYDEALKLLVKWYRHENQVELAMEFSEMIDINKRDDSYYKKMSTDYLALNQLEKAKEMLMHIQDKSQEDLETLAQLHFDTENYSLALYTFLQLQKENNQYNLELAITNYRLENYTEAVKYFTEAFRIDDFQTNILNNITEVKKIGIISFYRSGNRPRGDVYVEQFETEFSRETLNELYLNKGIYYIDASHKKAISIFSDILKDKDNSISLTAKTHFWRGISYLKKEKFEKAKDDFKMAAQFGNEDMKNKAFLKLGNINFSEEKYNQSLEYYTYVIENDNSGKLALNAIENYALVCKTIKEWRKAIKAYELILEKTPDQKMKSETLFDIAFCYYRDKQFEEAIEMFKKALPLLEQKSLKAEAQYWIGDSYYLNKDYSQAVTEFLKVEYNYSEQYRWAKVAQLKAGKAYVEMNEINKAKYIFNKIISKYGPGSDEGKQAKEILQNL